jgi:hypothetical protein
MRPFLLIMMLSFCIPAIGQVPSARVQDTAAMGRKPSDFKGKKKKAAEELTIENYKIITHGRDTTLVDTSLTIQKDYLYNYLRRDYFELLPLANVGQPYNRLGVDLNKTKWLPQLGGRARHFNYYEIEDIDYYNVATPLTELMFKTTFERGQLLDAMLTFNTSPQLNFSIAYKGFRSLGKYREDEVQSGNFRTTVNYVTKNGGYRVRAHYTSQDIRGQENGGFLDREDQFESKDPEFSDRSRIDVLFTGVGNRLNGKRYYLDHKLRLLGGKRDSLREQGSLNLAHSFSYESKYYQYVQENTNPYFGVQLFQPIDDKATLKSYYNQFRLELENRILGSLEASVTLYDYSYYFSSIVQTENVVIPNRLEGEELIGGAAWKKDFGGVLLEAEGGLGISGDLTGSFLDASVDLRLGEDFNFRAGVHHSARKPDFNYLLYQSDYLNYNWDNSSTFENEQVQSVYAGIRSDTWGNLEAQYSSADNYSFFRSIADASQIEEGEERAFVRPFQQAERINQIRVKYQKEFRWRKWSFDNTLLYQEVDQSEEVLNVPSLVTRNTIYFSSDVFEKAMFIQTGITFKYFTEYYMNSYNPLMAEFYVQDREKVGGFPLLDFFINARVRSARIYLKAEHFNSSFTGNNFFAAPNYPYRDFVIRFGLVWNFFS